MIVRVFVMGSASEARSWRRPRSRYVDNDRPTRWSAQYPASRDAESSIRPRGGDRVRHDGHGWNRWGERHCRVHRFRNKQPQRCESPPVPRGLQSWKRSGAARRGQCGIDTDQSALKMRELVVHLVLMPDSRWARTCEVHRTCVGAEAIAGRSNPAPELPTTTSTFAADSSSATAPILDTDIVHRSERVSRRALWPIAPARRSEVASRRETGSCRGRVGSHTVCSHRNAADARGRTYVLSTSGLTSFQKRSSCCSSLATGQM